MEDYAFINSPSEVIEAISTLLYQIGVSLDMRYSPYGSGCWSLPEYAMFDTSLHLSPTMGAQYRIPKHFGYKYSYAGLRDSIGDDTAWMQMLYQSLAEGKPIYYAGWASADNEVGFSNTNGHGYIIDGYFLNNSDGAIYFQLKSTNNTINATFINHTPKHVGVIHFEDIFQILYLKYSV